MKTVLNIIILVAVMQLAAQNNCSPFYPSEIGTTFTIHQFDRRDRLSTISEFKITEASANQMTLSSTLKDDDGDPIFSGTFKVKCEGGTTTLEPEALVSGAMMEQYQNMEYTISGNGMSFPNTLSVDQTLPDGEVFMKVDAGMINMSTTVTMTDRKVVRQESITVPAGTFDCYVITFANTIKVGLSKTYYTTQWISQGIGMVKEETKKANGNLVSKSILQSIQ
ncbi:hypothetical protein [Sediminibacter sp. Hel_I_10]|uniref:TapB family protein n=1 Tax=Sediminibacter sp. Hel_I_10 TaxID=1392490 RepID=UPI000479ECFD|nr:hypothetical protein [Sediminibacter sp. Hel_I_10]